MRKVLLVLGCLALASSAALAQGTIIIGQTMVLATKDTKDGGTLVAQKASLFQRATIKGLSVYVTAVSGNLSLAIYDDKGHNGGPGKLITYTDSFVPVVGWNTVPVAIKNSLLYAGNYWLVYFPQRSSLVLQGSSGGGAGCEYASQAYGSFPVSFPAAASCHAWQWSMYATLSLAAPPSPAATISAANNGDFGSYNSNVGPYYSDLNVWAPPTSSYSTTIINYPATYPNQTVMSWSFPDSLNGYSVYAYPDIIYGIFGGGYPPTPSKLPKPFQLRDIPTNFSLTYNVVLNAGDNQDLLIETWPTPSPNPPNPNINDTRTNEIGFFAYTPSYILNNILSFPNPIRYSYGGFHFYIVNAPGWSPPYTIIMPVTTSNGTTPVNMTGSTFTVPFGAIFKVLISKGILDEKNYITGYEFGFEIGRGSGSATINTIHWNGWE